MGRSEEKVQPHPRCSSTQEKQRKKRPHKAPPFTQEENWEKVTQWEPAEGSESGIKNGQQHVMLPR